MTKSAPLILIVDDYVDNVNLLDQRLQQAGYQTAAAYDGQDALLQIEAIQPDLVLLDIMMPKLNGIEVLKLLRRKPEYRSLPIIVLTAKAEVEDRIEGLDAGADEYLTKPTDEAELLARVRAMLRMREALLGREQAEAENERLRREMEQQQGFGEMVGHSAPMQQVYRLVQKVADAPGSVLITGESGTGKELVARAIHQGGVRSKHPFIPVSCGALPDNLLEAELFGYKRGSFTGAEADRVGVFEAADSGTLFLDEIGDVPLPTQVRLLRVLQEGEVTPLGENHPRAIDVRIVAATNRDLKSEIQAGHFREDLYFRLNVIPIPLPALRQRREDILPLANHFLQQSCDKLQCPVPTLTTATKRLLLNHRWPGNIRQLEHEVERAITLSDPGQALTPELLSEEIRAKAPDAAPVSADRPFAEIITLEEHERRYLKEVLERTQWIIEGATGAAELLGVNPSTLRSRMKKWGIKRP